MAGVDLFQHLTRSIDIFLLGTHSRLGQESHISLLVPDVLQLVCQYVMRPAMLMQCNEMVVTCYQEDKTRVQEGVESLERKKTTAADFGFHFGSFWPLSSSSS